MRHVKPCSLCGGPRPGDLRGKWRGKDVALCGDCKLKPKPADGPRRLAGLTERCNSLRMEGKQFRIVLQ